MPEVLMWEMAGYPKEDMTRRKFTATRKLLCSWANRDLVRLFLLQHPGQLYPYLRDFSVRCTGVATEPLGAIGGDAIYFDVATYEWAVITARYESPEFGDPQPYPIDKDPSKHLNPEAVISENLEPNVEALKLDYRLFRWSASLDSLKPDEAPVRIVHRMNYVLTRHYQKTVPQQAIDYVGKINSEPMSPILMDGVTFPKGTLLFVPPSIDLSVSDDGQSRKDVTYRFAYKEEGWRKFWRADIQAYASIKVKADDSDYNQPEEADLRIFQP